MPPSDLGLLQPIVEETTRRVLAGVREMLNEAVADISRQLTDHGHVSWLTSSEAAELLDCDPKTVRNHTDDRDFEEWFRPGEWRRVGTHYRYTTAGVMRVLRQQQQKRRVA